MASYITVKYGSRGDDVRALQNALNSAGYDIAVDGIFGSKTQAAVKQYQASKGLTVDGIVGKNTWGALTSAPSSSTPSYNEPAPTRPDSNSAALSQQLQALMNQFNSLPAYTAKTSDEIRKQAEGEYQSYYDQLRLAAQQQKEQSDMMLAQQREGLATMYKQQMEQSEENYDQAYSAADRQMLSRGMQRSSYAAQTLANIDTQGAQAQQTIADAQAAAESNVDEQRTLLAQQLAAQLAQYDAGEAADILNRIRELEDQEYQRSMDYADRKNALSAQIYEIMYQQERDRIADEQWQMQYEESVRQFNESSKKSSSGSRSSSSSSTAAAQQPAASTQPGMSWNDFVGALGNSGSSGGSSGSTLGNVVSGLAGAITSAIGGAVSSASGTASTTTTTTPKRTVKGFASSLTSVSRGQSK